MAAAAAAMSRGGGVTHGTVSRMIASHLYVMGYGTIKHVVLRFKWVKVHGEWKLSRREYFSPRVCVIGLEARVCLDQPAVFEGAGRWNTNQLEDASK